MSQPVRDDITFSSGGEGCAAWLYRPMTETMAAPVVVMAHGLSGTRRDRLGAFAERFAAEGLAALVFDHRGFGVSGGEPDRFEPSRQLDDWGAAIATARSLPGVDSTRVVTFGSSMGGGNALAGLTLAQTRLSSVVAGAAVQHHRARHRSPLSLARLRRRSRPGGDATAGDRRGPPRAVRRGSRLPGVAHFDIYDGPEHEAVIADELDFLRRHVVARI